MITFNDKDRDKAVFVSAVLRLQTGLRFLIKSNENTNQDLNQIPAARQKASRPAKSACTVPVYLQYIVNTYRMSGMSVSRWEIEEFQASFILIHAQSEARATNVPAGESLTSLPVFTESEDVWPLSLMSDSMLVRAHLWKNTNSLVHTFWFKHCRSYMALYRYRYKISRFRGIILFHLKIAKNQLSWLLNFDNLHY